MILVEFAALQQTGGGEEIIILSGRPQVCSMEEQASVNGSIFRWVREGGHWYTQVDVVLVHRTKK